jgi:ADP-L-glycero-D-manno-heptose 6-epimerase
MPLLLQQRASAGKPPCGFATKGECMIVVTGATGFIGSNLVHALNRAGRHDIVVVDSFGDGDKWKNLAATVFERVVAPADLIDWLRPRHDVDAVIHMGAISATTATDGDEVMHTNFALSVDLLDYCTERQIPFVYASSAAVYGAGEQGFVDTIDVDAIAALRPLNLYGWSKRQFDLVVANRMRRADPLPPACIGLRFFNVFGPNEYHKGEMMSIVAKIAAPIARGERITLFKSHRDGIADGDQRRDFVYVTDAVDATLALLDRRATGIFNIGTGHARSFRELAEAVFHSLNKPVAIDYIDMPESIRANYQYFTEASLDHLRRHYDGPFSSLEDSVNDYVTSYLVKAAYLGA